MPRKKKEVQETEELGVQGTEELEVSGEEELSAADEHDKFFSERVKGKKSEEKKEEVVEEEVGEEEEAEAGEEETEDEPEEEKVEEKKKAKTPKEEAEEAGQERIKALKKEDEPGEEEPPAKEPKAPTTRKPAVEQGEEPEPKWSKSTKKYFDEYDTEGEVVQEAHLLAVKAAKDYTNVLGNYALDNFNKFETRHDSAEKALNVVIEKLNGAVFWQEIILAGHSDAYIIARTKKFKDWCEKKGENVNVLKDSPYSKDAIKVMNYYKADEAEVEVKKHDDETKEKKTKLKNVLKHTVSSSTGTDMGGAKIAEDDVAGWWAQAAKEKKAKRG